MQKLNKKLVHYKFDPSEDELLINLVGTHGENWKLISEFIPGRNPKQCRERWNLYLKPDINKSPFTEDEDRLLLEKVRELGSQ